MDNHPTVLHIASTYKPAWIYGGPVISTSKLCEALVKKQTDLELLTTSANGKKELEVPLGKRLNVDGVQTTYYRRWIGDNIHFTPGLLWAFLQKHKRFKVIHIHEWWNSVALVTVLLCKCVGRKPILTPRGMLSPYTLRSPLKKLFHQVIGRWLLRGTILHATSEQEAAEALALVPGWPHFILPNIIDLAPLGKFPVAVPGTVFRLVFLSRVHPKKGLEQLFAVLPRLDFPWHLQIIGEGEAAYVAQLQALLQELGIAEKVSWLGWREGEEKFRLLAEAELFVLPSQNENFANAALEALSVGTPALLSAQVGLSTYVRAQELGWVYDGTEGELLQALKSAHSATGERMNIRQKASRQVHADFGAEKIAQQYLEAYRNFGLL